MNTKAILIAALVFIAALGAIVTLYKKVSYYKEELNGAKQAIVLSQEETNYYKTENGKTVAQVKALSSSVDNMRLVFGNNLKQFEQTFGPLKNLQSYVTSGIKAAGKIYTDVRDSLIVGTDSLHVKTFSFSDNFLTLNCVMGEDSVQCPYTYSDSVEIAITMDKNWEWWQFKKRAKLKEQGFPKRSPNAKVTFKNPNSTGVNVKAYVVKEK